MCKNINIHVMLWGMTEGQYTYSYNPGGRWPPVQGEKGYSHKHTVSRPITNKWRRSNEENAIASDSNKFSNLVWVEGKLF